MRHDRLKYHGRWIALNIVLIAITGWVLAGYLTNKAGLQDGDFTRRPASGTHTNAHEPTIPSQTRLREPREPTASELAETKRVARQFSDGNARCIKGKPFVIRHDDAGTNIEQVNDVRCEIVDGQTNPTSNQ